MIHGMAGGMAAGTVKRECQADNVLYAHARAGAWRGQVWSMLTGRSRCLIDLASVEAHCRASARCEAGLYTVPIEQIQGSEGRAGDFDRDFHPLQEHTRERWLGIARAMQRGRCLPPVALIQVGDCYFVRDGHHRISVARALGRESIEATVEVWQPDRPVQRPPQAAGRRHGHERRVSRSLAGGSAVPSLLRWLLGLFRPTDGAGESPACP